MSLILDAVWSNLIDQPFNLEYAVTYRCNLRCVQCNIWQFQPTEKELTIQEIERIFQSYRGFKLIGLTGGEPFLRDDLTAIVDVIAETQKHLKWLSITSNGWNPNIPNKVKAILEAHPKLPFTQFISVDGSPRIHDAIRGVRDAYSRAIQTLHEVCKLRDSHDNLTVGIVTVCSPFNINGFNEVLETVSKLKKEYAVDVSFCVWFQGQLYKNLNAKAPTDYREQLQSHIPAIKRIAGSSSLTSIGRSMFYDLLAEWIKTPNRQVIPCPAARTRYFLDPYGTLYPCTIYDYPIVNMRNWNYQLPTAIISHGRYKCREKVEVEICPICCNTCETIPAMMVHPMKTLGKWLKIKCG